MNTLRNLLRHLDVCDGDLEKGNLRCDANISVRPKGKKEMGTKTEIKNVNSFKFLAQALAYERERQIKALQRGERIVQETRTFDASRGVTFPMRSKEEAHDYRYFPEPDIPPFLIDDKLILEIKQNMPELPWEIKERLIKDYGLPNYDASIISQDKHLVAYYEKLVKLTGEPKTSSNWILTEVLRVLNEKNITIENFPIKPQKLATLIKLVKKGTISNLAGKEVFNELLNSNKDVEAIVKEKGLIQISDQSALEQLAKEILQQFPEQVQSYKSGKKKLLGFFVGQAMKKSKGKANPKLLNQILRKLLD